MVAFVQVIERESARFLEVLDPVDPQARVPTCPDWSADDLFWHLTQVHAFWAAVLAQDVRTDEDAEALEAAGPGRPDDRATLAGLYEESTAALLDQLGRRSDDEPAYFWLDSARTVGSTRRMQAHEATMHRIDAELTAGLEPTPVDPDLAADGVAHMVEVMWAWWGTQPGFSFVPHGGAVRLAATDRDAAEGVGRWSLQPGRWRGTGQSGREYDEPGLVLAGGDVETVAQLRGTVEDLYRWLWGRGPEPAASGEVAALTALREAQAQGAQ